MRSVSQRLYLLLDLHGNQCEEPLNHCSLPIPSLPRLDLIPELIGDAFGMAVVIVAIHVSMAKMFAKKHRYKIDAGQVISCQFYARIMLLSFSRDMNVYIFLLCNKMLKPRIK